MKKRSQIEEKYKWNTSDIYKSEDDLEKDIEFIRKEIETIKSFKGKLNNKKDILKFFDLDEKLGLVGEKVGAYLYLKHSENLETQRYVQLINLVGALETEISVASSFVQSEMLNNGDEFLLNLANDPDMKNYRLDILEIIRHRPHTLNEGDSRIVSLVGNFSGGYSDVFDNINALDVKFDSFEVNKKKYKVTNSNVVMLMENKNPVVREKAFKNLSNGYIKLANTIATNYIENLKVDKFYSNIHNHETSLKAGLFENNLEEDVYYNLIKNVNENVKLNHEYLKLRKQFLGLKNLNYSDLFVSLTDYKKKYTYDEMCDTVVDALEVMGEDYVGVVRHAIANRWIDVYPTLGKDTGGYCMGVYGVHPYILLNTVENTNSMFTLAHEMGHAMHSYLSDKTQTHNNADYPIFLAEIASTTNEVLLLKYLYSKATDRKEKIYLLDEYLQMFRTTLFRQTMFSEFEDFAHKLVENDLPISKDILSDEYARLNKVYYGSGLKPCKELSYEWLRIPHFYNGYYVYKYATGITSAICIASKILKGESPKGLIEFLSAGGSDYPNNILKKMGVDLSTDAPYKEIFGEMKWALEEMKKLLPSKSNKRNMCK